MAYSLGVDIGGTNIRAALVNEQGQCLYRTECPSTTTDRETLFQQVIACMKEAVKQSGISFMELAGVGIGVPGKVDCENGIALYQNNIPWQGFPLVRRIKDYFSIEHVVMDNDVHMAGFAEWVWQGKNRKHTFVYLTISTGISCAIIHHGDFVRGAGFAGEIGFFPVSENSNSGGFLRLEEAASGPGIVQAAKQEMGAENAGCLTTGEVFEAYGKGDRRVVELMNKVFHSYAKGIYALSCLLDPDRLVLGGGVINHNPDLMKPIQEVLSAFLVTDQQDLINRMYVSHFKGDSGLIGAGLRVYGS